MMPLKRWVVTENVLTAPQLTANFPYGFRKYNKKFSLSTRVKLKDWHEFKYSTNFSNEGGAAAGWGVFLDVSTLGDPAPGLDGAGTNHRPAS